MNHTDSELVSKYLQFKSFIKAREEQLETEVKPYKDGMLMIENEFLRRLDERGADNTKTDNGTAYKSTITNFAVVDQQSFLQFCLKYPSLGDMYTIKAVKDPIKEYMQDGHEPPPGIEKTEFTRVNIRRT